MKDAQIDHSHQDREEAIERLYDVALDPVQYETMVDSWEKAFAPLRNNANLSSSILLDDPAISKHFKRAEIFLERMEQSQETEPLEQMIAPFGQTAAFLVDRDYRIVCANPPAFQMLNITINGPVSQIGIDCDDMGGFLKNIRQLFYQNSDKTVLLRLRSALKGHYVILRLQRVVMNETTDYLLVASSELRCPENYVDTLREAFSLTKAEADVLQALVECCSVKEIAQTRGRSVDTIRAQIKSLLSKTEAKSQIELVRLALSLMDMSSFTQQTNVPPEFLSPATDTLKERAFSQIYTAEGRRVCYLVFGAPAGMPLLYLPMNYGLIRWSAQAEEAARMRGLKVVVPLRAGYGPSEKLPKDQDYCAAAVADMKRILAQEGIASTPVISQGSDSYLAFRLAHEAGIDVPMILACAGVLPCTRAEQYERMGKWHRFILAGAKYTPHLLPFMVKSGFYLARKIGTRNFFHAVNNNSPEDLAIFEQEEVCEAMTNGARIAISAEHSAHDGFTRYLLGQLQQDWSPWVTGLRGRCDVQFHNGVSDPEVPFETLQEFQRDYSWIDFHIYQDCGQLIFFRHWDKLLKIVENHYENNVARDVG